MQRFSADDSSAQTLWWLPKLWQNSARCIISCNQATTWMDDATHKAVQHALQPIARIYAEKIVRQRLALYNKRLDEGQMGQLMQNDGSALPLWLTLACEELRVFGAILSMNHMM